MTAWRKILHRNQWLLLGLLAVGLLLWGRLRYTQGLPRTAVADPAAQAVETRSGP